MPSANATAFYADGQVEEESEDEDDAKDDPDANGPDMTVDGTTTTTGTATTTKKKKISKRTAGYTPKIVVCLCQSWHAISQDVLSSDEQKENAY
jgi:hypothetical protein